MDIKDFLYFDKMLTPKIITIVYWLLIAACVIGGIGTMFTVSFIGGLFGLVFGIVFARIWCELMIVLFKMNDALQVIKNK